MQSNETKQCWRSILCAAGSESVLLRLLSLNEALSADALVPFKNQQPALISLHCRGPSQPNREIKVTRANASGDRLLC